MRHRLLRCGGINGQIVLGVAMADKQFMHVASEVKSRFQEVLRRHRDLRSNERQICITHGFGCGDGVHTSVAVTILVASILRELGVCVVVEHVHLKKSGKDCGCPFSCRNLRCMAAEDVQSQLAEWARDGATGLQLARRIWELP